MFQPNILMANFLPAEYSDEYPVGWYLAGQVTPPEATVVPVYIATKYRLRSSRLNVDPSAKKPTDI